MNILAYFRDGGTPTELEAKYGIVHRWHPTYPNLLLLKYDMIDSPMGEDIVQECRGLILDTADDFKPVAWPFGKFFNHGEGHADEIDWRTARVQEKLDGSLCTIWWYDNQWHVSTTGSPDAGGQVGDFPFTFKELFWRTFEECGYAVPPEDFRDFSFMFELTTKYNRVVVVHDHPRVTLLAVRNRVTGQEMDPETFLKMYGVVGTFPLNSFENIIDTFRTLDPLHTEGYVVVDASFRRVKVKHPGYVSLHHLKEGATSKNFLNIIRSGERTEFLTYFPEWSEEFLAIQAKYDELVAHLETEYEEIKHIESQKDFALLATKTRCPGALFQVRKGYVKTIKDYLAGITIDSLSVMVGIKEAKPKKASE